MSVIGLNGEEQQNVLQLTAAILHLGNITFVEDRSRSNTASVQDDQCNNNIPRSTCCRFPTLHLTVLFT